MRLLIACLFLFPSLASAADYAAFRACVEQAEAATMRDTFAQCSAPLVAHCGQAKTAHDAAACIAAERDAVEAEIVKETEATVARDPEAAQDVEIMLTNARGGNESSCAMMAKIDLDRGVKAGQRSVNSAYCMFIASADIYGLLLRMEE